MTGFGRGRASANGYTATVELKSVNHRYLEFTFKLPSYYFEQEMAIRNLLQPLRRGKVYLSLNVHTDHADANTPAQINTGAMRGYYKTLKQLARDLSADYPQLTDLLELPGVLEEGAASVSDDEWAVAQAAIQDAIANIQASRRKEGDELMPELLAQLDIVAQQLTEIEPLEAGRADLLKQKMESGLAKFGKDMHVDQDRYQQELFYYLEKYDIQEEKSRLRAHIAEFRDTLQAEDSSGRKLLFTTQELWRETTTLGNKSYNVDIQKRVVAMKEALEKVKEQMMNIV